jgi:protoporphyrinogen oxidase
VGRVQNFGSWSPYLVKDGYTCLGLEYFVNAGDDLWRMPDADLVRLATAELRDLRLVSGPIEPKGYVVRVPKAYPVYDAGYAERVTVLREWLEQTAGNVLPVGRNGMHKYNNQDHSMLTAKLAVENLLGAEHDLWAVNVEADYHEEVDRSGTGRAAPLVTTSAGRAAAR